MPDWRLESWSQKEKRLYPPPCPASPAHPLPNQILDSEHQGLGDIFHPREGLDDRELLVVSR